MLNWKSGIFFLDSLLASLEIQIIWDSVFIFENWGGEGEGRQGEGQWRWVD